VIMRFKNLSPLVLLCVLCLVTRLCHGGRLPDLNGNVFEMTVDDDGPLMNGDAEEQKLFQQFEKEQMAKFVKEEKEEKKKKHKPVEEDEEDEEEKEKKRIEEEEEAQRKIDEAEKKERELKKEKRLIQEEKEREAEHEKRQEELKKIEEERKRNEEEAKERKAREQREHNKKWRDSHEGRKKSLTQQEKWQQEQAEEAEGNRKRFEEIIDSETEVKRKEEAEAAELRVLEPHIDTHTKEQKEKLKEMEQKREEHADDVIDRLNPDEIVHAGEEKEEKEEKKEVVEDKEESEKDKKDREEMELKAKLAAEADEIKALEPHVEIHNKTEKKMEQMMKDKPFQAGDLEAAVHGGGHVHGHGDDKEEVPVVGVHEIDEVKDMLHHKEKEEEKGEIGAEDPEHLMHGGGNHEHGSKDKKNAPGLNVPGEVQEAGGDFAHDDSPKKRGPKAPQGKVITREDIEKLGLSADLLKGVDLTKLLARDQRQYERYQNGEDEEDDDDDDEENKNSFWGQMSRIRKDYLESLARRIRFIGMPDLENAEWDKNDLDNREMPTAEKLGELKKGETPLEHLIESSGNTASKGKENNVLGRFAPKIGEVPH